jgi:dTDP-4-amino-4,6-dideoxygalactose transaminase
MGPETIGAIVEVMIKYWGVTALIVMAFSTMAGISVAQLIQMKRWQPQTREIALLLRDNISVLKQISIKLDTQHTTCTSHYALAQEQIEGMAGIGHELQAVVKSIAESDRTRNSEIMQLMTVIASRQK